MPGMPIMPANALNGLVFDLDMTLLDREASLRPWLEGVCAGLSPEAGLRFRARFGELDAWGQGSRRQLFASLAAEFGLSAESLRRSFFAEAWRAPVPYPDARPVLGELKAMGYRLGLLSEGRPALQRRKLGTLADCFEELHFCGPPGLSKPEPRLFALAAAKLGLKPGACAMIGDHPMLDLQGAAAAGLVTIWLRRYDWPLSVNADLELEQLAELPAALRELQASEALLPEEF